MSPISQSLPINIIINPYIAIIQITYSLPKYLENDYGNGSNVTCTEDINFWTDDCTVNVSEISR